MEKVLQVKETVVGVEKHPCALGECKSSHVAQSGRHGTRTLSKGCDEGNRSSLRVT